MDSANKIFLALCKDEINHFCLGVADFLLWIYVCNIVPCLVPSH
jgi:hypothetical protein